MVDAKIELNERGLGLLCAALYLRQSYLFREAVRRDALGRALQLPQDLFPVCDRRTAKRPLKLWRCRLCEHLEAGPDHNGRHNRPAPGMIERARALKITDFAFGWHHLYAEPDLIGYVKPRTLARPACDRDTPIAKRWGDSATQALERLYLSESAAFDPENGPCVPDPALPDEISFAVMVADICQAPEPGKAGRPPKSGPNEALMPEIIQVARAKLHECGSKNGAAKAALAELDIVIVIPGQETGSGREFQAQNLRSALNTIARRMDDIGRGGH